MSTRFAASALQRQTHCLWMIARPISRLPAHWGFAQFNFNQSHKSRRTWKLWAFPYCRSLWNHLRRSPAQPVLRLVVPNRRSKRLSFSSDIETCCPWLTPRLASAAILLCEAVAADCPRFAVSGIPAFHAVPPPSSPASDRDQPARSAPARPVNFPSLSKGAWSILFRQRRHRPPATRLSPASRASPACLASTCRHAQVLPAPRAPCPVPTTLLQDDIYPQH